MPEIALPTKTVQDAIKTVVDTVNTNLTTVDSLVDTLITRLGTQASTASNNTSGNAHAKLNWLLSTLATVNTNTATANLGSATATASKSTSAVAHAKLNYLLANMLTGAVKSVQRGSASLDNSASIDITITSVNMDKTLVLVETTTYNASYACNVAGVLTSSKTLNLVKREASAIATAYWQVIEFY